MKALETMYLIAAFVRCVHSDWSAAPRTENRKMHE